MSHHRAPALFVGHGAAILTADPRDATHQWLSGFASTVEQWGPRGVVVVSAHDLASPVRVSTSTQPGLMHDHPATALHHERYDAPGNPTLALELISQLKEAGLPALGDAHRALDHGAWLPLRHLRPAADWFVVQVSLPGDDWKAAVTLGRVLASVRERAIVLTSGGLIHDQGEFRRRYFSGASPDAPLVPAAQRFEQWALEALRSSDPVASLLEARSHPDFHLAHPTPEHFVPLLVAAAAGSGDTASVPFTGVQQGLSTTAVQFG
jgi:4,5-DOPA dioxygenase extradiol